MRPLIATVIGDPGGIGPEVCVKALASKELRVAGDYVLIGSLDVVRRAAKINGVNARIQSVRSLADARGGEAESIFVLDDASPADAYQIGKPAAASGRATYKWIGQAIQLVEEHQADGLIIAPVDTTSFKLARIEWLSLFEIDDCYLLRTTGKCARFRSASTSRCARYQTPSRAIASCM